MHITAPSLKKEQETKLASTAYKDDKLLAFHSENQLMEEFKTQ
jgi:hypothetical protein